MTREKKILILGAGTWQVPYIKKAKEMDLTVICCDWSPTAPGRIYADVFEPIDLKNKEAVLQFATQHAIDAIITGADIGVPTTAYVAEQLSLPSYSQDLAINATNKYRMREKARHCGIPIPSFAVADSLKDAKAEASAIGYPVIVKPTDSCSSRGVRVLRDSDDLESTFHESIEFSVEKKVLIEELMSGTEGSVEAIVTDGDCHILGICDKEKSPLPYRYDLQLNYPGRYTQRQYNEIEGFISKLIEGFEIENTIIHVEIITDGDSVKLIEFALRGCGTNVITHMMPEMRGFDIVGYLINLSLNRQPQVKFTKNYAGILKFIMLREGRIKGITGIESILNSEHVIDFGLEKVPGDRVTTIKDGRSRPGYCIAVAETLEIAENAINNSLASLNITYY